MEHHKDHNKEHKHEHHHKDHHAHHKVHHKVHHKEGSYHKVFTILATVLVLVVLYNQFQIFSLNSLFDEKLSEVKEAARPADVELMVITTESCEDCYDINSVVGVVESTGVNILETKKLDFKSAEATALLTKYNVEVVPTVIVTGELDKTKSLKNKFTAVDDAFVFTNIEPPYIDVSSGNVRGMISLIQLEKTECEGCQDMSVIVNGFSEAGLQFSEQKTVSADSEEGKSIITKYNVEKLPAIIMDKEAEVYPNIVQSWTQLGTIEMDGAFVIRSIPAPFFSIEKDRVVGYVTMTILRDATCETCYDPNTFHKPILQRMGVVFGEEKEVNVSTAEGQSLVSKYNIEKVPTILLTGDVEEHPVLISAWKDVGDADEDGTYIFRKVEVAQQPYKDLTTDEIVG